MSNNISFTEINAADLKGSALKDGKRFMGRIKKIAHNQESQSINHTFSFPDRVKVDNIDFANIDELELLYNSIKIETIIDNMEGLFKGYCSAWYAEGIKDVLNRVPQDATERHSLKTSNGYLTSLQICGRELKGLEVEITKDLIEKISLLRKTWYSYYGFYDLRLSSAYIEYGKNEGLSFPESLVKYVEKVSIEDDDTYILIFGGNNKNGVYYPNKVLGHIGMVHGLDCTIEDLGLEYNPDVHILHVDKIHLTNEDLSNGNRIVKDLSFPVKLKNVKEITRFIKSPFLPPRKHIFVSALLTAKMCMRFIGMQKEDDLLLFADLDRDIAGKSVSQIGIPNSFIRERYAKTKEKQGLLLPRWLKDDTHTVKTGPTVPLFFTGRDLIETRQVKDLVYKPKAYLKKVFDIAGKRFLFQKNYHFHKLIKESIANQLNSIESKHVVLSEAVDANIAHTGQVGGPEGLIKVANAELSFAIATQYYGKMPNYLPLPYTKEGIDFSQIEQDILDRVLFPLNKQGFIPAKYNLDQNAQTTPLGNIYSPMLKNIDCLKGNEKDLEKDKQITTIKNLLARSKFIPLIKRFIEDTCDYRGNMLGYLKPKYFSTSKLSLSEVRKITSSESMFNIQNELFSNSIFICAGLGTGGMQLVQDLRKSIPVADYILIDHGVVDCDNGHQVPTLNELGASKLAVAIDCMMKTIPIAPWGTKENVIGGVVGFASPYSEELNEKIIEMVEKTGKDNVVFIDEIDVTDSDTILQKIQYHKLAIAFTNRFNKSVSVVCGLDLGQTGVWRGHYAYDKDAKPFYGLLSFKEIAEERAHRVSPLVLLAPLLIGSKLPMELELLLADMARDGSIEGVGQTVYSSNQSSVHVGNAAMFSATMQSLGFSATKMRQFIQTSYIENPISSLLTPSKLKKYESYSGRDGKLLLPFLLHLSREVYDAKYWPSNFDSIVDPKIAYEFETLRIALDS